MHNRSSRDIELMLQTLFAIILAVVVTLFLARTTLSNRVGEKD